MYARLELEVMRDGAQGFQKLAAMRQQTESSVAEVREMQRSASHETFANIELSVARGETGLAIAKQVRDLSATTLVVGSSVMTGGAAVAVLGGGSVLRGVSKYQTSGNIGSAVLSATGSFVVGAIPLGGGSLKAGASLAARVGGESIRYGERAALIVVGAQLDAQFEGATALIEGRSAREALRAAATRFGIDLISGGIGTGLDRWALPVAVRLLTDSAVARGGDTLAAHEPKPEAPEAPAAPRATAAMPAPTAPVCDANSVLSSGNCSARDWVRQIVLQEAR